MLACLASTSLRRSSLFLKTSKIFKYSKCYSNVPLVQKAVEFYKTIPYIMHAKQKMERSVIEVSFDGHESYDLDFFWLRDNCPSEVHPKSFQRLTLTSKIPLDIKPTSVKFNTDVITVEWPDNHSSSYTKEWIWTQIHRDSLDFTRPNSSNVHLWSGESWAPEEVPCQVDYHNLMEASPDVRQKTLLTFLEHIRTYGFALVTGSPPTPKATREVSEQIGHLRSTIFGGDFWDYVVEEKKDSMLHNDTAYTTLDIKPHTDGTYHFDPVGVQVFHCLEHQGTGGINGIVDGWHVVQKFKKEDPEVYRFLTTNPVEFYYSDQSFSFHSKTPIARLNENGDIMSFRFNNHDRSPPSPFTANLKVYHRSIQLLERALESPDNMIDIKLTPDKILYTYGWRVLHARTPFTGRRRLAGCYVGLDDFLSKYRVTSRAAHSNIQLH